MIEAVQSGYISIGGKKKPITGDQYLGLLRELRRMVVPDAKSQAVKLDLPVIQSAADVLVVLKAILAATADGRITLDEAQGIAAILEIGRKAIEAEEFDRRLTALEKRVK